MEEMPRGPPRALTSIDLQVQPLARRERRTRDSRLRFLSAIAGGRLRCFVVEHRAGRRLDVALLLFEGRHLDSRRRWSCRRLELAAESAQALVVCAAGRHRALPTQMAVLQYVQL
jgi:hypothetical protein